LLDRMNTDAYVEPSIRRFLKDEAAQKELDSEIEKIKAQIKGEPKQVVKLYESIKSSDQKPRLCLFEGTWMSQTGDHPFRFALTLNLLKHPTETYEVAVGTIDWTLLCAPPGSWLVPKVGKTAQEMVAGTFDAQTGALRLSGYEIGPGEPMLIAIDEYSVKISRDGETLTGFTRGNAGTWLNPFNARKRQIPLVFNLHG
jgi:hypothetical protein